MGRRKIPITESTLEMIISINQRLTDLVECDIPKRLHSIEEKLDYINPKFLTIDHVDRFYSAAKTVFTVAEACEYMGITESHLYKLTSSGKIPHYKPTGKLMYFDRSELDDWLLCNKNVQRNNARR
jgi:excisionase family DNA binding protein